MDMVVALAGRELVRAGRDRRTHITRWLIVGWLLFVLYVRHAAYYSVVLYGPLRAGSTAEFAGDLVDYLVGQQTLLILLVVPSFAAGAVTDEKVRGTLEALFLAHLSPASVIVGKLLARVALGFVFSLAVWPVIAFVGFPGGVTPVFFLALGVTTMLLLLGVCALSLLCSVWTRTTREAVVSAYVVLIVGASLVVAASVGVVRHEWLAALNPVYVLDAARHQPDYPALFHRLRLAVVGWAAITAVCAGVAIWRLRPAYIKQLGRQAPRRLRRLQFRPAVTDQPITWREQHTSRWPRWLGWLAMFAVGFAVVFQIANTATTQSDLTSWVTSWFFALSSLAALTAGVHASGSIVGERDRKTWEVLLTTPERFDVIIDHKMEGIVNSVWPYWIAGAIGSGLALSLHQWQDGNDVLVFLAALVVAGFVVWGLREFRAPWTHCALVVAIACGSLGGWMVFVVPASAIMTLAIARLMTAVGLYVSARSTSGWVSLVVTVLLGSFATSVLALASTPLACASCCTFMILTAAMQKFFSEDSLEVLPFAWALGCMIAIWWGSVVFRGWVIAWLVGRDRIPEREAGWTRAWNQLDDRAAPEP